MIEVTCLHSIGDCDTSCIARVKELEEALSACRPQWIHSVHRARCLDVLGEKDQYPCSVLEHDYCRRPLQTHQEVKDE